MSRTWCERSILIKLSWSLMQIHVGAKKQKMEVKRRMKRNVEKSAEEGRGTDAQPLGGETTTK